MIEDLMVVSANSTPMGWPMRRAKEKGVSIKWTEHTLVLDGHLLGEFGQSGLNNSCLSSNDSIYIIHTYPAPGMGRLRLCGSCWLALHILNSYTGTGDGRSRKINVYT